MMEGLSRLAEYGSTGVAIAILLFFAYALRLFLPVFKDLVETVEQMRIYLKQRNGYLEKQLTLMDKRLEDFKRKETK